MATKSVVVALPENLVEIVSCQNCGNQGPHDDFYNHEKDAWECPDCADEQEGE